VGRLIEEAGLAAERLEAAPSGRRRYLWKGERLHRLPAGPLSFLATGLFPAAAKLRLCREPWIPPRPPGGEESIADFVRRRLGGAFLDYAVGPFVSGVYAGDPERLSVDWAVPKIAALEREHGSLLKGALARRKGPAPRGKMISFPDGLAALPERLAREIGIVWTGTPCRRLARDRRQAASRLFPERPDRDSLAGLSTADDAVTAGGASNRRPEGEGDHPWHAETDRGSISAREVVLAVPADVAARLLEELTGGESRALADIPYAPVVVACLGFRRPDVAHSLDGFGFLAPRKESLRLLGCLFSSSLFPGRAPDGHVALTAFAGGRTDPGFVDLSDEEVYRLVLAGLDRALGLAGEPVFRHLARWPRAIPQYELGHGRFVELAARLEASLPGLHLRASYLGGVSVPDCIAGSGELAAAMQAAGGRPPTRSPGTGGPPG
jgi:oxygen-dependent protoporphyrinogen oxidase